MTTSQPHRTVLLIGTSRGLGLALAEEYLSQGAHVVATVRGDASAPLRGLAESHPDRLEIETVDITVPDQIASLRDRLADRRFDLLFVIAGTTNDADETPADVSTEEFARLMVTNALSPMRVIETLGDLVPKTATIAVMSSGQGSVANNTNGGFEIYRASKAALNQLMRSYAARHVDDSRTLLLTAPGWVKTDLGGPDARLTIEESIPRLVAVIDAHAGEPGLQFLDYRDQTIAW